MEIWERIAKRGSQWRPKQETILEKFEEEMNETFNETNVLMLGLLIVSLVDDKKKALISKSNDM
jgi:hypothetical protein